MKPTEKDWQIISCIFIFLIGINILFDITRFEDSAFETFAEVIVQWIILSLLYYFIVKHLIIMFNQRREYVKNKRKEETK